VSRTQTWISITQSEPRSHRRQAGHAARVFYPFKLTPQTSKSTRLCYTPITPLLHAKYIVSANILVAGSAMPRTPF